MPQPLLPQISHSNKSWGNIETKRITLDIPKSRRNVKITVKKMSLKKKRKSVKRTRKKKGGRKRSVRRRKATLIQSKTPRLNKEMKSLVEKSSYSPSLNRKLKSLRSISPLQIQGCVGTDILDESNGICYKWHTKKAKQIMLRSLVSKKHINCDAVTAPKQLLANCWFNSFFVTFFISDKGRKFNRWLREAMITGVMADGRKVPKKLRKPFFLLNKYIEASLRAEQDETNFANLMDTNDIIRDIYKAIGPTVNRKESNTLIAKSRKPSNPLSFYRGIYNVLGGNLMSWLHVRIDKKVAFGPTVKEHLRVEASAREIPKVLFIAVFDDAANMIKTAKIKVDLHLSSYGLDIGNGYKCTYTLDSAVLRDIGKHHFSAYLTCNGKEYGFDGESFSRMEPFAWKKK